MPGRKRAVARKMAKGSVQGATVLALILASLIDGEAVMRECLDEPDPDPHAPYYGTHRRGVTPKLPVRA